MKLEIVSRKYLEIYSTKTHQYEYACTIKTHQKNIKILKINNININQILYLLTYNTTSIKKL